MRQRPIESTIAIGDVPSRVWDTVVIGAGPAGSIAARALARTGAQVLLVDKAVFPRSKVCGCCLNGATLDALADLGLGNLAAQSGARPLWKWRLCSPVGQAVCRLTAGYSLSREVLDAALVRHAIAGNALLLDRTQATVWQLTPSHVNVLLVQEGRTAMAQTRVVIVADGVAGRSLVSCPQFAVRIEPTAMHGAHTILGDNADGPEEGTILMACGCGGYVGMVRLEDGRLDIAAAFDRSALRKAGPEELARQILRGARLPIPRALAQSNWLGTPPLTRRLSTVAANRVFVVGDAAGYTEPFTGQGLAWAMHGAIALSSIAKQAISQWTAELDHQWNETHADLIVRTQYCSRLLGWVLRSPQRTDWLTRILHYAPWLAAPVVRALDTSPVTRSGKKVSSPHEGAVVDVTTVHGLAARSWEEGT